MKMPMCDFIMFNDGKQVIMVPVMPVRRHQSVSQSLKNCVKIILKLCSYLVKAIQVDLKVCLG